MGICKETIIPEVDGIESGETILECCRNGSVIMAGKIIRVWLHGHSFCYFVLEK